MSTTDRRITRTKKAIREAFSDLMLEKNIENISIRELADKADISRSTFYMHYQDIYDLYGQIENEVFAEMNSILYSTHDYRIVFETLIDYFYNQSDICRIYLCNKINTNFHDMLISFLEDKYFEILAYELPGIAIQDSWKFICRYQIEGFIASVRLWLETGLDFPKDEFAKLITDIDQLIDRLYPA